MDLSQSYQDQFDLMFSRSTKSPEDLSVIAVDNIAISRVHSTKFLGVTIDDNLSWTNHIVASSNVVHFDDRLTFFTQCGQTISLKNFKLSWFNAYVIAFMKHDVEPL